MGRLLGLLGQGLLSSVKKLGQAAETGKHSLSNGFRPLHLQCLQAPAPSVGVGTLLGSKTCSHGLLGVMMNKGVSHMRTSYWRTQLHSRRSYYTDRSGYTHFGGGGTSRWGLGPTTQIVVGAVVVGSVAYYWSCIETIPYTHRRHAIMFVSLAQERELGKMVFEQQLREAAEEHTLLHPEHPLSRAVRKVGQRVAAVATDGFGGGVYKHMQNMQWEFVVINNPTPNAYVVPGGKVVVFKGLLDMLESEDELAAVLAHETAHILARHHAERISTMNAFAIVRFIVYMLFGFGLPDAAVVLGVFLPYSRLAEHEADAVGLRLMARTCYDPAAAPSMLAKLNAKERQLEGRAGVSIPQFLRTHPLTNDRVNKVKEQLPEAYKLYEQSGCGIRQAFIHPPPEQLAFIWPE